MSDVLLISCYELGHRPHGVALPMAFLERAGVPAVAVDLAVEPFDDDKARRARFVGISVPMHTALRIGVAAARRVRACSPRAHVCFYGLYAQLNREYLLDEGIADSVLSGEIEEALVAAVRGAVAPERPILARLSFPAPSRAGLPRGERYARLLRDGGEAQAGYVEASRGCRHLCRHCPIPPIYGGRFFVVPERVVLQDVRAQVAAGARHITFGDPDFLNGPEHARRIARALHAAFPELTFDATAKVEHLVRHGRPLIDELAACGLIFVVTAVESLSPRVLEILDKHHTRADVDRALELLEGAGVALRPSLVPFTPWETLDGYLEILEWIAARGLVDSVDPVQVAIRLLVPHGSLLETHPAMRPHLGSFVPEDFTYRWTHPDPRMDALCAEVAAMVERDTRAGRAANATFERVRAAAFVAASRTAPARLAAKLRPPPPRLSEPWFC